MIAFKTPVERMRFETPALAGAFRRQRCGRASSSMRWSMRRASARRRWRARTEGYPAERVPRLVLAKGNYFGFAGRPVFSRLIYPTPVDGGLGAHVTLDLAGRMRFGPDVEWIDAGELQRRSAPRATVVLRQHPHLLAGAARQFAGAGLCRHPAEADRAGRAGGRFHDRAARRRTACRGSSICSGSNRRG